jgi:hypothetical protein
VNNDYGREAAADAIRKAHATAGLLGLFRQPPPPTAGEFFRKRAGAPAASEQRISKALVDRLAANGIGIKPALGLTIDDSGVSLDSVNIVKAIHASGSLALSKTTGLPHEGARLVPNNEDTRRATASPAANRDSTLDAIKSVHARGPRMFSKGLPPQDSDITDLSGSRDVGATGDWRDQTIPGIKPSLFGIPGSASMRSQPPGKTDSDADATVKAIKAAHAAGPTRLWGR